MTTGQFGGGTGTVTGGTSTFAPASYSVNVTIERQATYNKFFAIPIVGIVARSILLIPHVIALYVLALVVTLANLVLWIPTLTGGTYPAAGYTLVGGTLRWGARVAAYFYGLTDVYPPFGFGSENDGYPVGVSFDTSAGGSKLFAIPIIGYVLRAVALIPHIVVLYVIGAIVGLLQLGLWVPVLMSGNYPDVGHSFVGGYIRWAIRVYSFFLGLTDEYPPFRLGN
jgi:hypothetical protein